MKNMDARPNNVEPNVEPEQNLELLLKGDNWELPTRLEIIDLAGKAVEEKAKEAGLDEESAQQVRMGFEESLANGMGHGNYGIPTGTKEIGKVILKKQNSAPTDKKIYVDISSDKKGFYIKVRDEGDGFNPSEVPDPTLPKNLLKEQGRGLFNMKNLYFNQVEHIGNGNTVILTKFKKE